MLQPANRSELTLAATWITSAQDCEFWAGGRVSFPINPASLPEEIGFCEAQAYSVFDDDWRLVGFGRLIPKTSDRGHLATLIVCPSFRRQGYGAALVRDLIAIARQAKFGRVSLYVSEENVAAIALYTKLMFRNAPPPADDPKFLASRFMEYSILEERGHATDSKR
jgi:ribosomal protein S18 acetylase RimI-like enzyme